MTGTAAAPQEDILVTGVAWLLGSHPDGPGNGGLAHRPDCPAAGPDSAPWDLVAGFDEDRLRRAYTGHSVVALCPVCLPRAGGRRVTGTHLPTIAVEGQADGHRVYTIAVPLGYTASTPAGQRLDAELTGTRAVWWVDPVDTRRLHVRPVPPAAWDAVDSAVVEALAAAVGVTRVQVVRTVSSEIVRAGR